MASFVSSAAKQQAQSLDESDGLRHLRSEFIFPAIEDIQRKSFRELDRGSANDSPCTYLVGNSLGLQPARTLSRVKEFLDIWATRGVQGHFTTLRGTTQPQWLDVDDRAAEKMAPIVGARKEEVAVMQTLSMNLHLLMCAFYRPDKNGRHKIILEQKAFPSDHFVVETQIAHHGLATGTSLVTIPTKDDLLSTDSITSLIEEHASTTSLILLPGIQYYNGQFLDIARITACARRHGIFIIWDLAHAVGNVPLSLHEWDVDAAAWCSYKYLNGGPGCIGGLFVHERHTATPGQHQNRLAGWWGNEKATRFVMKTNFVPAQGAAGFQLSNPSVLDMTSLLASLEVFELAGGVRPLREKSVQLTRFLEELLEAMPQVCRDTFRIMTPVDANQRGAQLSLLLDDGLLEGVMNSLEASGVLVDDRKPNVVRVAPAPLYNSFEDCIKFVEAFGRALTDTK